MYRDWPFFQSFMELIEMILAKADPSVSRLYVENLLDADMRPRAEAFHESYDKTVRAVLEVTGHATLLENNVVLQRSIGARNPYVDPLNML